MARGSTDPCRSETLVSRKAMSPQPARGAPVPETAVEPHVSPEEPRLAPALADSRFELTSDYEPKGDQPAAIEELLRGLERNDQHQCLLGVTGSGKTFTVASVLARVNRPALVLDTTDPGAQLYHE